MFDLTEHEQKHLEHARNIRWRQFRPVIAAAIIFAFLFGAIWGSRRGVDETPPVEARVQPPPETPATPSPPPEPPPVKSFLRRSTKELLNSVVHISTEKGAGSGIVIYSYSGNTFVLTAAHVVRHGYYVSVDGFQGIVAYRDTHNDLALVQVDGYFTAVELAKTYSVGDQVWSVAFPQSDHVVGEGLIVDVRDGLRATAPVFPGMSGGGLFVWQNGFKLAATIKGVSYCASKCLLVTDSHSVHAATIATFLRSTIGIGG